MLAVNLNREEQPRAVHDVILHCQLDGELFVALRFDIVGDSPEGLMKFDPMIAVLRCLIFGSIFLEGLSINADCCLQSGDVFVDGHVEDKFVVSSRKDGQKVG